MESTTRKRLAVRYDLRRLADDMAERGWMKTDLARAADVSNPTVTEFFAGRVQTAKTAAKFAAALGTSVKRYLRRRTA